MKSLLWIFCIISINQVLGLPYSLFLIHDDDSSEIDISRALKELDMVSSSSEETDEVDMVDYMRMKIIMEELENNYLFKDLLERGYWSSEDEHEYDFPARGESRESLAEDSVVIMKNELEGASVENMSPEIDSFPNVINVNELYMNDAQAPVEERIVQKNIGEVERSRGSNKYAAIDDFLTELNKDLEKENMHRQNAPKGYASPGAERETMNFNTHTKISPVTTERSIWSKLSDKIGSAISKAKEVIQQ